MGKYGFSGYKRLESSLTEDYEKSLLRSEVVKIFHGGVKIEELNLKNGGKNDEPAPIISKELEREGAQKNPFYVPSGK